MIITNAIDNPIIRRQKAFRTITFYCVIYIDYSLKPDKRIEKIYRFLKYKSLCEINHSFLSYTK